MNRYIKNLYIIAVFIFLIGCSTVSSKEDKTKTSTELETYIFEQPNKEYERVYFTCKNWDSDIYLKNSLTPYQDFSIISLDKINLNEIEIVVPIQSSYAIMLIDENSPNIWKTDYELNNNSDTTEKLISDETFPYYLYQCYRGIDWKKMKELYDKAQEAANLIKDWNGKTSDSEYVKWKEDIKQYDEYKNLYLKDYEALTSEVLPQFYVYTFRIFFGVSAKSYDEYGFANEFESSKNVISESFKNIDIQIENISYTENIGEVRIWNELLPFPSLNFSNSEHMKIEEISVGPTTDPWGDGTIQMADITFEAQRDLTLTKMYLYESNITVLGTHIIISDKSGSSIDFYWDAESALDIEKGKTVTIELIIQDSRAMQLEYGARACPVIEYMVDSQLYKCVQEQNLDRWPVYRKGIWIRYATLFDGLGEQIQSYFDDYYRPIYETWREELPW